MGDTVASVMKYDIWCRTTSGDKASTTFTWTIEDFLSRPEKNGEAILSSPFTVSGPNDQVTTWRLTMYPWGESETSDVVDAVPLYIENTEKTSERANFRFSILDVRGQKELSLDFPTDLYVSLSKSGKNRVGGDFIFIADLENNPDLLPSGNLTVVCDLTVHGPVATMSGSKFPQNEKLALVDNSRKQMCEQVGKLFSESKLSDGWGNSQMGKFSDVKITCGEEVFHCHRCILSVRSPVGEGMS